MDPPAEGRPEAETPGAAVAVTPPPVAPVTATCGGTTTGGIGVMRGRPGKSGLPEPGG
ncbi:hypothetical protein N9I65_03175 [bacterium]|nr:hypothetical protein [bacterium]